MNKTGLGIWYDAERLLPDMEESREEWAQIEARLRRSLTGLDAKFVPIVEALASTVGRHDANGGTACGDLIASVIGGRVAKDTPSAVAFDDGNRIARRTGAPFDVLLDTFIGSVPAGLRTEWVKQLCEFPNDPTVLRSDRFDFERRPLDPLLEQDTADRTAGLIAYQWGGHRHHNEIHLKGRWISRGRVLLAFDSAAFAKVLETLPLRGLRDNLVFTSRLSPSYSRRCPTPC